MCIFVYFAYIDMRAQQRSVRDERLAMMTRIKRWLRTCAVTKSLYQRLYDIKFAREERCANAALKNSGAEVLSQIKSLMRSIDAEWYLAYGTCLGALRNHQFIGHDTDMDFYLCPKPGATLHDVNTALAAGGYKHHHDYEVNGVPVESSWELDGVNFDIFVLEEKEEGYGCYLFNRFPDVSYACETEYSVSLSRAPHLSGVSSVDLAGVSAPIPANAQDFMSLYYGENWMTPDPSYTWENSLNSRIRCSKLGYYKSY